MSSAEREELRPWKSRFRQALDALLLPGSSPMVSATKQANNTGAQNPDELSLRLMELNFPNTPHGGTLEAGMFGFGFKGSAALLNAVRNGDILLFNCWYQKVKKLYAEAAL